MELGAACSDVTGVCADVNALCVSGICECKAAYYVDALRCRMYTPLVCHALYLHWRRHTALRHVLPATSNNVVCSINFKPPLHDTITSCQTG